MRQSERTRREQESVGALSARVMPGVRLVSLLEAVEAAGGIVNAANVFPATKGEPEIDRVVDIEVAGISPEEAAVQLRSIPGVAEVAARVPLRRIFGKRVIVIGGGAQVTQVNMGAVSEADRHNLRGERISVDTIPLAGEQELAAAVRAVADLPRAEILVLAGAIMGGEITRAVEELRATGLPVVALNMVGSVTRVADLVVSDPVQAGTMAVMAIADTARFDIARQRGKRY